MLVGLLVALAGLFGMVLAGDIHVIRAKSTNWMRSPMVRAESCASYLLTTAATFTYTDTREVLMGACTAWSPTAGPTNTGGEGTAILPGVGTGILTTPPAASAGPGDAQTCARGRLTQGSTHRYGLPVLLAVVALVGVVTILGRYLLAQPAAGARRTRSGASPVDQPGGLSTDPDGTSD